VADVSAAAVGSCCCFCYCWIAGLLDCWIAGLLDCWMIAGLLDCWMIAGLLDCWIVDCGFLVGDIPLMKIGLAPKELDRLNKY